MKFDIQQMSAIDLRKLLVNETRAFIDCINNGIYEDLEKRTLRLKEIHELLDKKERNRSHPVGWADHKRIPGAKGSRNEE